MIVAVLILLAVFLLIAIRQIGKLKLQIWLIMLIGALCSLFTGQITILNALKSINIEVMLFLFGMFVVGQALDESGVLGHISYSLFRKAKSANLLILSVLFVMGIASAFLMNDTIAIIGTPIVLLLAKSHKLPPKLLLLSLAFAITIGSAMSPIGNPQNLLIALNDEIHNPFITFLKYLLMPTAINLLIAFFFLRLFYRSSFSGGILNHSQEEIKDPNLAKLSGISLALIILMIMLKISVVFLGLGINLRITYIALIPAIFLLLFSQKRVGLVRRIDWHTLIFFAAMFVLMESVWDSGFFQSLMASLNSNLVSIPMIFFISIVLSQFISNVPLVALYLPILSHIGISAKQMIALAAGSTIAGNLFILGAASNVIIIQNAEKKSGETLTFWDFAKIGVPLTIANTLVYMFFIWVVP